MKKIHAKSCLLKEINDLDLEKSFLNDNHIQGYTLSNVVYGLYYNSELVFLMSFGKPRFNSNYQWELIRECSKKDYTIYEATSTVWNRFLEEHSCCSCICYSYPHNDNFTEHYVKYCGFKNIQKSYKKNKLYYIGEYNGTNYEFSIQYLTRFGVDRLLGTKFGNDNGTNEQILIDKLGFSKEYRYEDEPQVDIYFPFSVIYKITDLDDNKFYIGKCELKEKWDKGYLGSGDVWTAHLNRHPNIENEPNNKESHHYKREILYSGFKTPKDLYNAEVKAIKEYGEVTIEEGKAIFNNSYCINLTVRPQGIYNPKSSKTCSECGGRFNQHKKGCSKEKFCEYCGYSLTSRRHAISCPKYKEIGKCKECGSLSGKHKKTCSQYKSIPKCEECGNAVNSHKKTCSKYKEYKRCLECGNITHHKPTCSKYTNPKICAECGGKRGTHKKGCSKNKVCPECGSAGSSHKRNCSQYKKRLCNECGHSTHLRTCSKYKERSPCPECGSKARHKKECSRYKKGN